MPSLDAHFRNPILFLEKGMMYRRPTRFQRFWWKHLVPHGGIYLMLIAFLGSCAFLMVLRAYVDYGASRTIVREVPAFFRSR